MSISNQDRQALTSIENDLARSGPELAAMLAMFTRLSAGEAMPLREHVDRLRPGAGRPDAGVPAARERPPGGGARIMALPEHPARRHPAGRLAWVVFLVTAVALIAVAVSLSGGSGKGSCLASPTAACQQKSAPAGKAVPGF